MSKNILLTGGCGYLGSNFVKYWTKKYPQDSIKVIDKLTYAGRLTNLGTPSEHWSSEDGKFYLIKELPNVKVIPEDVNNIFLNEYNETDLIIHTCAETHVDNSLQNSKPFMDTNIMGTHRMLLLAKKLEVPFIHISTDEVLAHTGPFYDDHDEPSFILSRVSEDGARFAPKNPYSASKAAAEMLCLAYRANYEMDIKVVRPTNLYGPENQALEKFLPKAITNLLSGKKVPLYGTGANYRDWLWVEDLCYALDLIIHNTEVHWDTYHVAPNNETSNKDILKKVLDYLGISWEDGVELVKDRLGHDLSYSLDSSRIRSLGWAPSRSLDDGIKQTVDYYRNKLSGREN